MAALKDEFLPHYTYDDYIHFEGKWEIIRGIPYNMAPAPLKRHQFISNNIAWQLKEIVSECPNCLALLPVDYKIDEDTVVQPDNMVVCNETLDGAYISKAPIIIFEILSKATALKDTRLKYQLYEKEGVNYYIIVDPFSSIAKLYRLKEGKYLKVGDFDHKTYTFDIDDCEVVFDFSKIWH